MNAPANIYSAVIFDLHPRISGYLDELNKAGQIDLDGNGYPYVIAVNKQGPNHVCQIVRNGQQENFILNTRKKRDPICSWDQGDGFMRRGGKRVIQIDTGAAAADQPRPERRKRTIESFKRIVDQIVEEDEADVLSFYRGYEKKRKAGEGGALARFWEAEGKLKDALEGATRKAGWIGGQTTRYPVDVETIRGYDEFMTQARSEIWEPSKARNQLVTIAEKLFPVIDAGVEQLKPILEDVVSSDDDAVNARMRFSLHQTNRGILDRLLNPKKYQ